MKTKFKKSEKRLTKKSHLKKKQIYLWEYLKKMIKTNKIEQKSDFFEKQ